jgi:hypothetical protein
MANYHQQVVNKRALDTILSIRTERALRNDFTVSHDKKIYQIKSNVRAKKGRELTAACASSITAFGSSLRRFRSIPKERNHQERNRGS